MPLSSFHCHLCVTLDERNRPSHALPRIQHLTRRGIHPWTSNVLTLFPAAVGEVWTGRGNPIVKDSLLDPWDPVGSDVGADEGNAGVFQEKSMR
jgi:hypothetical protein